MNPRPHPGAAPAPGPGAGPAAVRCDLVIRNAANLCLLPPRGRGGRPAGGGGPDDLGVIRGGTVAILQDRIVWAGPDSEAGRRLSPAPGCRTVDASGCTVTPGLIDPHAHLPFAGSRAAEFALRLAGASYLEILQAGGGIMSTVRETSRASDGELLASGMRSLSAMLAAGTTTVEAKSGYGLSTEAELRLLRLAASMGATGPLELVPTFLGAHAVPPRYRGMPEQYVELLLEEMLPAVKQFGLAEFCDVFCEPGVFTVEQSRRVLSRARDLGLGAKIHADEMSASGGAELAAEVGAVSADHLLFASEGGLEAMSRSGTVGVLLPVTVLSMLGETVEVGHCRRQAAKMKRAGVELALGTDYNPGTAPCPSMTLAMGLGSRIFGLTAEEALAAATRGAARALGRENRVGSLEPGYQADVTVFEVPGYEEIPYRLGDVPVRCVVKRGTVVFRAHGAG